MLTRDENCGLCPLNDGYAPCQLAPVEESPLLVVTERPLNPSDQARLAAALGHCRITALGKCGGYEKSKAAALRVCRDAYLVDEVEAVRPKAILALGASVARALGIAGKLDLIAGQASEWHGVPVIPTYSYAQVKRDPTLKPVWKSHLKLAVRYRNSEAPQSKPDITVVDNGQAWGRLFKALRNARCVSFDIETNSLRPYSEGARIESIALTTLSDKTGLDVFAIPLGHPESKYAGDWEVVLLELNNLLPRVKARVAHNGKFDCKWLQWFGLEDLTLTYDTMLAGSLLDENRRLSLKHMAQAELGVEPWAIDALACAEQSLEDVLTYNALDTYYTMKLYLAQRRVLTKDWRRRRILTTILMPASNALTLAEQRPLPVHRDTICERLEAAQAALEAIEQELSTYTDEEPKWGSTKWLSKFLYEDHGFPVLERTNSGAPSTGKAAMGALRKQFPDDPIIGLLDKRRKLEKKIGGFYKAYLKQLDEGGELHTTFRLGQTVTGRTSSGKEVAEGSATDSAGINLQQVPRDPDIRGLYRAPEGWCWVEADYSQLELRVAASIAKEDTMLRLYREGADLHSYTAQQISGQAEVSKEWRTRAKAVNFGFLYGMGARAFQVLARDSYGVDLTLEEAQSYRAAFFQGYPRLKRWHEEQKALAKRAGFVATPFGRRRHLPILLDRNAPDDEVARALRQSVNSPVQGQGSDMCLWALGRVDRFLRQSGCRAHIIGTVHDSIDVLAPRDEAPIVGVAMRRIMENLPMAKVFQTTLPCPIVSDVQIGPAWGEGVEIPSDVSVDPDATDDYLRKNSI